MIAAVLGRLIDLRPGEGPLAFKAFGALFGLIAGHTILETARDALFLKNLPASRLTFVYIGLAVIGLILPAYNSRFVRTFGRRNASIFTLMVAAVGTVMWHFQEPGPVLAYGLYLWSGLLGTVLVVQYWMLSGQLFTAAQGKRLFPGIASGGVLGAVSGGVIATAALEVFGMVGRRGAVSSLLLISALMFLGTAVLLTTIASEERGTPFRTASSDSGLAEGFTVLKEHPYVRLLGAFVALSTITVLTTDYLFKYVAKASVEADALGVFFARYYAALNAVALIMQIAIAQRIVQRLGVVAALSLLPLLLLGGGASIALLGGSFVAVLLTKGADGALRHSLHRVATELLYLPLPGEVRDSSKTLLDAVFVRGAQALTAFGILCLATLGLESVRLLATIVAVCAGGWVCLTLFLKAGYLDLFRSELGRGALDPRLLRMEELDIDSVESVMHSLSSTDPSRVTAALDLLKESGRAGLVPALILYHESDEVLLKALDIVSRNDEQEWRPHATRLSGSGSIPVRVAALRALGRACESDLVRSSLADPSPVIQAHAAFQLARCADVDHPEEHPVVMETLAKAQESTPEVRREMRLAFLDALRVDADARWANVMYDIARADRSPAVVRAVATAVARVPDERFIPLLVDWLDVRDARTPVREALTKLGSRALDALEDALKDPERPEAVRRQIPITIAGYGSQRAADLLMDQLKVESDGLVRYRVLRGLGRLVTAHAVKLDRSLVESEVSRNLREQLRLMSLCVPLETVADSIPRRARGSAMLLSGLLNDKMRQASERAFRLLKVLFRNEDVRGIFVALQDADKRVRANALEFLDALILDCDEDMRALARIVADDLPDGDKVARAADAGYIDSTPQDATEALARLMEDDDDSVVAITAYYAMAVADDDVSDDVAALIKDRPSLAYVAEAADALPPVTIAPLVEAYDG